MLKNTTRFTLFVLLLGFIFNRFFWEQPDPQWVISLYLLVLTGTGFLLAYLEGIRPARPTLLLVIPIVYFAAAFSVRSEPFTQALSLLAALGLLMLLARTFRGGKWPEYGLLDYLVSMIEIALNAVLGVVGYQLNPPKASEAPTTPPERPWETPKAAPTPESAPTQKTGGFRRVLPVLRGLLLALPVVIIFAGLLAQADPVFEQWLDNVLKWFDIERIQELLAHLWWIAAIAYLAAGVLIHALLKSQKESLLNNGKPLVGRVLGFTESVTILGSVEMLFLVFVFIQFRYFFGGEANINLAGYTYAEYARRGFNELIVVVVFSLLLFMGLSAIARRSEAVQQRVFSGMVVGLAVLLGVILVSAFQRLVLYEAAYGFTRLRMYSHIFMIWLGVLLAALVVLELTGRERHFILAGFLWAASFVAAFSLVNIDGMIVNQNLAHAHFLLPAQEVNNRSSGSLDSEYLASLSSDAVPALAKAFENPNLEPAERDELGFALACHRENLAGPQSWQEFHFSTARASRILDDLDTPLKAYPPVTDGDSRTYQIEVNGELRYCYPDGF